MAQDRGYALIPVAIAGQGPLWFVLDTAANSSVISPATRDLLGLAGAAQQAEVTGASGQSAYQAVEISSVDVGGFKVEKLGAVVIDLKRFEAPESGPTFAGLLGNDFLRKFDFVLDIPRETLTLQPRGLGAPSVIRSEMRCVPNLADDEGWIVMDLAVSKAPVRAIIDTGAGRTIFNWRAARAAGVTPDTPGLVKAAQNAAGLGSNAATTTSNYRFPLVEAGPVSFTSTEVRIADLPVFKALGLGERPAAIFGTNYLRDRAMAVSYSSDQVCFSPPA